MNLVRGGAARLSLVMVLVAMVASGLASFPLAHAASSTATEGLARVHSRNLDELRLRPGADLAVYRQVLIDSVDVAFHPEWMRDMNRTRARRVTTGDAQRIAAEYAASLSRIVGEAFQTRGYGIAAAPGPGVLRLSARVADLYLNAPEEIARPGERLFTRETGTAILNLEARDSATNELLVFAADAGTARGLGDLTRANEVSNRFWYDALFRYWAKSCSEEISAAGVRAASARAPAAKH